MSDNHEYFQPTLPLPFFTDFHWSDYAACERRADQSLTYEQATDESKPQPLLIGFEALLIGAELKPVL